ncbi:MAG TPA: hypothetical protein VFD70_01930 [Anaerolineae bacterium]|nr:hypothetical protein [Anaerolineae bacterium]
MKRQLWKRKPILLFAFIAIALLVVAACAPAAQPTAAPPTSAGTAPTSAGATNAPTSAPAATNPPAATSAPSGGATATPPPPTPNGGIIFHSSQFSPVNEAEIFRNVILKDSPVLVDFQPQATGPFVDIVMAQHKAGKMNISIIGGQHGDFPAFVNAGIMEDRQDGHR